MILLLDERQRKEHEFAQNKDSGAGADSSETPKTDKDGFMEAKDGENPFD